MTSLKQLESRLDDIKPQREKNAKIQEQKELLDPSETDKNVIEEFEKKFFDIMGLARNKIVECNNGFQI